MRGSRPLLPESSANLEASYRNDVPTGTQMFLHDNLQYRSRLLYSFYCLLYTHFAHDLNLSLTLYN